MIQPRLTAQKAALEGQGFTTTVEIVSGLPKFEVNRVAAERGCSLVVVGTHGHTMSSEVRLGGVASEIIHNARQPVLLVRLEIATIQDQQRCVPVCQDLFGHLLFPTDFSDNAEHAFLVLKEFVARGAKRITLLHVQDQAKIGRRLADKLPEFNRIDAERLERMKKELTSGGHARVECELASGAPVSEILARVRDRGISLVLMGSQGRGYISEVFLGSVSHNVARLAPASVLLVPAIR